jgi:hypothetical protein
MLAHGLGATEYRAEVFLKQGKSAGLAYSTLVIVHGFIYIPLWRMFNTWSFLTASVV